MVVMAACDFFSRRTVGRLPDYGAVPHPKLGFFVRASSWVALGRGWQEHTACICFRYKGRHSLPLFPVRHKFPARHNFPSGAISSLTHGAPFSQ